MDDFRLSVRRKGLVITSEGMLLGSSCLLTSDVLSTNTLPPFTNSAQVTIQDFLFNNNISATKGRSLTGEEWYHNRLEHSVEGCMLECLEGVLDQVFMKGSLP